MRESRAKEGSGTGDYAQSHADESPVCRVAINPQQNKVAQRVGAVVIVPGGVLYDDTHWRRWLLATLCRLGWQLEYRPFCQALDEVYLAKAYCGLCSFDQAVGSYLRSIGLSRGQVDEVITAGRSRREYFESTLRPLPGVSAAIEQLSAAGISLAILADSTDSGVALQQKLTRLGLGHFFDVLVSSSDLRSTMPEATNYRAVCLAVELPAQEVAFVGGKARDLSGATAFGMRTIACNFDSDVRADQYASGLRQAAELIGTQMAERREVPRDRAAA